MTNDGTSATVTLVVDVGADVGKIGSVTGRLHYDPALLTYDSDVSLADGTLRAVNPAANGVVRFAGASATGIDITQLATFRFKIARTGSIGELQFDVEELHDLSRTNLTSLVRHTTTTELRK